MFWAGIVTLFPEMFSVLTDYGITSRAFEKGLVKLEFWNPRDFAKDPHKTVDDRPYGGGPGMVMKVSPLREAIQAAKLKAASLNRPGRAESPGQAEKGKCKTIYLSPQGKPVTQAAIRELLSQQQVIFVAGRYEGVDERLLELEIDEEWSIGDYVLSGGELPTLVLLDALIRLIPGALGHQDSAAEDSFSAGLLDCPHYTRPEKVDDLSVPSVLLQGDHKAIATWRLKQQLGRTYERRPDLLKNLKLNETEEKLLEEYLEETREQK